MYHTCHNFHLPGRYHMHRWEQDRQCWAAYSIYQQKADHELHLPQAIISGVVQGQKRMYEGRTVHHMQAGDVLLIPAGSLICSEILWRQQGYESLALTLPYDLVAAAAPPEGPATEQASLHLQGRAAWHSFLRSVQQSFTAPPCAPDRQQVQMQALRLIAAEPEGPAILHMLLRAYEQQLPRMTQTIAYDLPALRQLEELAQKCCMSKATLKRRFQAVYNMPPMRFVWQKRLELAAFLLRTTALPVQQIAYTIGFENISHFHRLFRNSYGMPPLAWRKAG